MIVQKKVYAYKMAAITTINKQVTVENAFATKIFLRINTVTKNTTMCKLYFDNFGCV